VIELSSFTDTDEEEVEGQDRTGLHSVVAIGSSAKLVLIDTDFSSKIPDQGMLKLVADAEAVVRGCHGANATIAGSAEARLGIVNSTFEPSLVVAEGMVQPPRCDELLAGRGPMCDPRAVCTLKDSGGVECRCEGDGLTDRLGSRRDGSDCVQLTSIQAGLVSSVQSFVISKPGQVGGDLVLSLRADGEASFSGVVDVIVSLEQSTPGGEENVTTLGYVEESVPFGQRINFAQPLSDIRRRFDNVQLDRARRIYSWQFSTAVQMALDCSTAHSGPCARDGDVIKTVLVAASVASGVGATPLRSIVTIVTRVRALVSQNHSTTRIVQSGGELTPTSRSLAVELTAFDMDGLPIDSSQPQVRVEWSHTVLRAMFYNSSLTRVGGSSNVFVAAIPIDMRSEPGEYRLRVVVMDGWDERRLEVCEFALLTQTFVLESPNDMKQVILASLLALVVVLVFALFLALVYRNPGKAKELLLSFATFEGMLTLEVRYGVRCRSHEPSSGALIPVVVGSAAMRRSLGYRRFSQRPGFIFLPANLPATAPLLQLPSQEQGMPMFASLQATGSLSPRSSRIEPKAG
jgi:hypothetical protein